MPRCVCRLLPAALLLIASSLHAQRVEGRVVDRGTQGAVASATVVARSESGRVVGQTVADTAGKFVLALNAPGSYHLSAERIGYRPVTTVGFDVDPHETVQVDLFLGVGAVELDPLTITSRAGRPHVATLERAGFYQRERNSPGVFMRREEVERSRGLRLSDLLVQIPGVRKGMIRGRAVVSLGRSGGGQRVCTPAVYLDGQPIVEANEIDEIIHVGAVEAVEVYRGPGQTPPRFSVGDTKCGVVVIWTQERV